MLISVLLSRLSNSRMGHCYVVIMYSDCKKKVFDKFFIPLFIRGLDQSGLKCEDRKMPVSFLILCVTMYILNNVA